MPKIPESWKRRRARKLRHVRYNALQRIGLSTAGSPLSGETALCIAYMCPYAYTCPSAAFRPALVSQRDCYLRYPVEMRPRSGLSEHAIDTLAAQRRAGRKLNPVTLAVLDQFRPDGPSQSFGLRRPPRPVYADAPAHPLRPVRTAGEPVSRTAYRLATTRSPVNVARLPRVHVAS
ncbi:MAG: hypothetical protein O3B04_06540 [Chloroflexi bacterium]|nr:hypothetical protein [Chloroflexota bacterium]